ncbi:primosomal protein N' [Cloacibacterium rupense]|uniref:Replication restart protein PriA n=1 Tax=Cloacibacterium rupense TaxID=517423 RepID=A0ABQ2NNF5_9FLAO|nr:primosomal protein N' [Cloacibacterium rupense]GGP05967.1 primosomal protein N' [Cloacibacterium rupense]
MTFAQIILPLNLKGTFTYKVSKDLLPKLALGMRVLVPFGGKKIYTGIVAEIHENEPETFLPKEIHSILDAEAIVPEAQLQFWNWLSEYYLCNIGEIYRFAFPSSLKLESETYLKRNLNKEIDWEVLDANETYLLQALEVKTLVSLSEIEAFIPKKEIIKTVNTLIDEQYILIDEQIFEKYKAKEVAYLKIDEKILVNLSDILQNLNKAKKQKDLFLTILQAQQTDNQPLRKSQFFEDGVFNASHLRGLVEKNLVVEYYLQKDRIEAYEGEIEEIEELSETQKKALAEINEGFEEGKNTLLHGVTSSGKTHLYLEKIEETVGFGKNVLFLLPEIALTKQITQRLEKKYGKELGFYHQKMSDFEKVEVWRKIKRNEIKILIGTRSSLFLPFQNLGLIIVDEEHDNAYKPKEVKPYFNAKDAAQVLAKFYDAKVILGSATPSVESYYASKNDRLKYVFLGERFGEVALPKYEIINFKEAQETKKSVGHFSEFLIDKISENLQHKKQSIILHNRRGYANVVECETCGNVTYCSNCDVVMTYHKATNEMKCHYCGHKAQKPKFCPKCHSENLNTRGIGVEQIEEETLKIFKEANVERMDVDSMRKKFAYEKLYEKIENGEAEIIVGTQMISKGLDFDNIELVAIPKADSLLYVQDFRAEERAYQLITQVSGRAGRISGNGKIYIQTYNPYHPLFELIKEENSAKIYEHFLKEREQFLYPPFVKLILIEIKHRKEDKVNRASQFLSSILQKYLPLQCILGPEKAPIGRINLLYQYQILLKLPRGKKYQQYKEMVLKSFEEFNEITAYKSIKIETFVDV